jgi:dihydroflavonol-4-reductase
MPKVIVTGASGHIGFHVAKALLSRSYELHVLVRSINTNIIELQQLGARVHTCNLLEPATYMDVLSGAEALFHLAAENTTSMKNAGRVLENTDTLTRVVLDSCEQAGIKTVIYTSSVVVIGRSPDPTHLLKEDDRITFAESPYVQGKLNAEIYVEGLVSSGRDIRRVYPSWAVGPETDAPAQSDQRFPE